MYGLSFTLKATHKFEVVGEVHDEDTALLSAGKLLPDVVIIALNNPGCHENFEVCRQIIRKYPHTAVIILSLSDDTELLLTALKAGASAYVNKNIIPARLLNLVQQVGYGQYPISDNTKSS